jgi:thiol-disulfide isomerase/thioredoxin
MNPKESQKKKQKRQHTPAAELLRDEPRRFSPKQLLAIVLVIGFLVLGIAPGTYGWLQDLLDTPCLGCLGLYPKVELEGSRLPFTFDTEDDQPHPEYVMDALENGTVFIEFTQNDEVCPPCARMKPKIKDLEKKYDDRVVFIIININENELRMIHNGSEEKKVLGSEKDSFHVYDTGNIAFGSIATPTYFIITWGNNTSQGDIQPYFAVGYGEFVEEDAEKTKKALAKTLDHAIGLYDDYNYVRG